MTEEQKAAEYRRQQNAMERARLARYKALAGSKAAYAELLAKTEPLKRDEGWDPTVRLTSDEERTLGN